VLATRGEATISAAASTSAAPAAAAETEPLLHRRASGDTITVSEQLDTVEQLVVDMPPLLLLLAARLMEVDKEVIPQTPMMAGFRDSGDDRERTDLTTLMIRLWLLRTVFKQPTVQLSVLLGGGIVNEDGSLPVGGIDVGDFDVNLRVPKTGYSPTRLGYYPTGTEFAARARDSDICWAYIGPGNRGVDSWMFLRTEPDGNVFCIQIQSKKRSDLRTLSVSAVVSEAKKVFKTRGVKHILVFVTDHVQPQRPSALRRFWSRLKPAADSVVVIPKGLHDKFYGGTMNLLKTALAADSTVSRLKRTR